MKITMLTSGTRGDVQPYVSLGIRLKEKGHTVTLSTGGTFKDFVENTGLRFHESSIDFMAIMKTEEGQAIFNGTGSLFRSLRYAREVITPLYRKTFTDFLDAALESDLIIYHPKSVVAVDIAQSLKIPCVNIAPEPIIYPVTEFPFPVISPTGNWGSFFNQLTYKLVPMGESSNIGIINDFRKKELNLPARRAGSLTYEVDGTRIPIIYPISPSLLDDVSSWKERVLVPGFYYLPRDGVDLDPQIKRFLRAGNKPLVISFSSMPLKRPEVFKEKLLKAIKITGDRLIILSGISSLDFDGCENILTVEKAPHRLIFPEAKGIIHHGGIGTLAEALLSGVPNAIMPFGGTQTFWAKRMSDKGLSVKTLKEKALTHQELAVTFNSMGDEKAVGRARRISEKIKSENGIEDTIVYLESLVGKRNAR